MDYKLVLLAFNFLVIGVTALSPITIKIALGAALFKIKSMKQLTINNELLINVPKILEEYGVGYAKFNNLTIYGFDTMAYDFDPVDLPDEGDFTVNNIPVNLSFAEIGVRSKYYVDMGILDTIPVYGEGDFRLGFNETNVFINLTMSDQYAQNISIRDFDLKFVMRDSNQNYIRNFWKNEVVSNFLSSLINDIEPLFCAWYDYNSECIDCILSRIIQKIADQVLYPGKHSHIKCRCLNEVTDEMQNILDGFLQALDSNTLQMWIKDTLKKPQTVKVARKIYDNILLTVKDENNLLN
ncbi:unnamed protein product [Phyllotreta striolata]|uniref:Uncharacterized protein n=1 Tax=Phyllotreta striolata TaxID=444603 RepID=A0A9N9TNU5_PHYSR|nr:unnamed protein product [Phyllotreta striolata]